MNEPSGCHHDSFTTLFYALNMAYVPSFNTNPEPADIISFFW